MRLFSIKAVMKYFDEYRAKMNIGDESDSD